MRVCAGRVGWWTRAHQHASRKIVGSWSLRADQNFGFKKQLQDAVRHLRQSDIRFKRVNSDEFDPQYVAIGQKKSSVYIIGNEGPENEPFDPDKPSVILSFSSSSYSTIKGVKLTYQVNGLSSYMYARR